MTRVFREIEGRIEKEPAARAYKKAFMDDRNHRMVESLVPLLERGKAFVAVGAAHLPGEEGLLHLLEQQGYRITRVSSIGSRSEERLVGKECVSTCRYRGTQE